MPNYNMMRETAAGQTPPHTGIDDAKAHDMLDKSTELAMGGQEKMSGLLYDKACKPAEGEEFSDQRKSECAITAAARHHFLKPSGP